MQLRSTRVHYLPWRALAFRPLAFDFRGLPPSATHHWSRRVDMRRGCGGCCGAPGSWRLLTVYIETVFPLLSDTLPNTLVVVPKTFQDMSTQSRFHRAYKACNKCRLRKTRCNITAEEYSAGLPCARCRREMKECTFPDERQVSTPKRRRSQRRTGKQDWYAEPHRELSKMRSLPRHRS